MEKNNKSDDSEIVKRIIILLGTREQSELTDYLGLKKYAMTEWKNGKSASFKKYIVKIAEFFNVSLDYLVFGKQMFSLSDDEEIILKMYRYIDKKDKLSARKSIENIAVRSVSNARKGARRDSENRADIFEMHGHSDVQENEYEDGTSIARMYDWLDSDKKPLVRKMIEEKLKMQADAEYQKCRDEGKEHSREAVGIAKMYGWLDDAEKSLVAKFLKGMIDEQLNDALLGLRETDITFAVARSDDNQAPRIITNDLDDILNAPDATDEY